MAHKKAEVYTNGYIGFVGEKDDARACFFSLDLEALKEKLKEYGREMELDASELSVYDVGEEIFILRGKKVGFTWDRI